MRSIILPGHRFLKAINLTKIAYLKGNGNYTVFHLTSGKQYMVSQTMKKYAELPGFIRISKGAMLNKAFVERVERIDCRNAFVVTRSGLTIPIARRRIEDVIGELNN